MQIKEHKQRLRQEQRQEHRQEQGQEQGQEQSHEQGLELGHINIEASVDAATDIIASQMIQHDGAEGNNEVGAEAKVEAITEIEIITAAKAEAEPSAKIEAETEADAGPVATVESANEAITVAIHEITPEYIHKTSAAEEDTKKTEKIEKAEKTEKIEKTIDISPPRLRKKKRARTKEATKAIGLEAAKVKGQEATQATEQEASTEQEATRATVHEATQTAEQEATKSTELEATQAKVQEATQLEALEAMQAMQGTAQEALHDIEPEAVPNSVADTISTYDAASDVIYDIAPKASKAKTAKPPSFLNDMLYLTLKLSAIALTFTLLLTFLFGIIRYQEPSMAPAIKDGDLVLFHRYTTVGYLPRDLIVLDHSGKRQVRRVVATAGDEVDITADGLLVNGAPQQELEIYYQTERYEEGVDFPLTVPEGQVFLLSDSRTGATDSRIYGCVEIEDTLGKVITVIRRRSI